MVKLFRWMLVIGVAALLVGCGDDGSSATAEGNPDKLEIFQSLHLTLDGEAGPEVAGLATAYQLGYFEEAGIGLEISEPVEPDRPVQYVVGDDVDISVTNEPQVVLSRKEGVPVVAVGTLVPEPTMAMIWLPKSKINGIADLKGKTIATPGVPFQEEYLQRVLARAGLSLDDVKLKSVAYDLVPELVKGRADAIFGGSWNVEGVALEARGLKPVITRVQDLGIPDYDELVVITREDRLEKNPKLFRLFMAAVRRGTEAAIEDPEVALEGIEVFNFGEVDRKATKAGLEATLPLLSRTGR